MVRISCFFFYRKKQFYVIFVCSLFLCSAPIPLAKVKGQHRTKTCMRGGGLQPLEDV